MYWTHAKDSAPETGQSWHDRSTAHANKKSGQIITFVATAQQRDEWQTREHERFSSGQYMYVPWVSEPWYRYAPENTDDSVNARTESYRALHYAHVSIHDKGLIAYTPSDEFGVQDRQLRVRPGKYLATFAPNMPKTEVDAYCSRIRADHDQRSTLHIVTSADDIERVYRCGPSSCMSKAFPDQTHPVRAYGDSDLSLAYLGDIESHVTARTIIWPERKRYSRIYGDAALRYLLEAQGYVLGDMEGAKVRAIADRRDRWIMPYIDGISQCELTTINKRKYFVLDNSGAYECNRTDGFAEETEQETYICSGADECDTHVEDDGGVCEDCRDNSYRCDRCDETFYDDNHVRLDEQDLTYCETCADRHITTCEVCDEQFVGSVLPRSARDYRANHNLSEMCLDCAETHAHCGRCNDVYLTADTDALARPNHCADCQPEPETETETETEHDAL